MWPIGLFLKTYTHVFIIIMFRSHKSLRHVLWIRIFRVVLWTSSRRYACVPLFHVVRLDTRVHVSYVLAFAQNIH